jgi:hypothetical protein
MAIGTAGKAPQVRFLAEYATHRSRHVGKSWSAWRKYYLAGVSHGMKAKAGYPLQDE